MTERPVRYALTLPTGGPCADPRFLVGLAERAAVERGPLRVQTGS